jgi:putative ABC transport system permease protein
VLKSNSDDDYNAVMPLGSARTYVVGSVDTLGEIVVDTVDTATVQPAVDQIIGILSARHHIRDPMKADFTVKAQDEVIATSNHSLFNLGVFVLGAAAASLVVGAVGIANVMLVSVTQRTTEIGVRRAVGARRREIVAQFLIESAVLTGVGGGLGVIIGIGVTLLEAVVVPRFTTEYGIPEVSPIAVSVAFAISVIVGIVAGVYPARRAARVLPIEALRYE